MTVAVEELKKDSELWFSKCGIKCDVEFAFNVLEKKKQIKMVCPKCGSETHIRHMANGKIRRQWYKGKNKKVEE